MGEVINFSDIVKHKELKGVQEELEVSLNIFNEATGDLVDPAIYRYNEALEEYNKVFKKERGSVVN